MKEKSQNLTRLKRNAVASNQRIKLRGGRSTASFLFEILELQSVIGLSSDVNQGESPRKKWKVGL